jgi:hypothetical protein
MCILLLLLLFVITVLVLILSMLKAGFLVLKIANRISRGKDVNGIGSIRFNNRPVDSSKCKSNIIRSIISCFIKSKFVKLNS